MKHTDRSRKIAKPGEQARIVLSIMVLLAALGLFSSCSGRHMADASKGRTSEEPTAIPRQPEHASETHNAEDIPSESQEPGGCVATGEPSADGLTSEPVNAAEELPPETDERREQIPVPGKEKVSPAPPSGKVQPNPSHQSAPSPEPELVPSGIVNPYVPYTWDQMMEEAKRLEEKYPDLIRLSSAGISAEGRDLLVISLGTGDTKILLCGAHHAREYITSSFLMKMVEAYAESASLGLPFEGFDTAGLLSRVTMVVVPMVNPDGVNLVNNGPEAVTDREAMEAMVMVGSGYRAWKANINGVDLNRQYPAYWDEKYDDVGRPASENYKGTASATEPEVVAMMSLARSDNFVLSASFHTKGEVIYWADSGTVNEISGARDIARRIGRLTGYELMPVSEKPSVFGAGFENWFRKEFLRPSFCIELTPSNGTDKPHDDRKFDTIVWEKAKCIGLLLAEEALKLK